MKIVPRVARFLSGSGFGFLSRLWHRFAPSLPVKRTVFGFTVYYDFRDNPYYWVSSRRHLETMERVFDPLQRPPCAVWDVGSNVGLFSLRAAQLGHRVTAFDISPKAIALVEKSARANGFAVATVPRAFAVESFRYEAPDSCRADNRLVIGLGANESITFQEAAARYGAPALIKMDIEGAESGFLASREFHDWLTGNAATLILELHGDQVIGPLWDDVPRADMGDGHLMFTPRPVSRPKA